MKAASLFAFLLAVIGPSWGEDPFTLAEHLLAQHAQTQSAAPAMTLKQLEQIAMQANPEIRVASRRVAIAEAHVPGAGALALRELHQRSDPSNLGEAVNPALLSFRIGAPPPRQAI